LVIAHRYLTDDDLALPAEEAYRELRELRATLLDMLSDGDTVLSAAGRRRFWDGFAAFQFRYADLYVREHDRRRRPEALAPYRALRERPAYRLLRRLQLLEARRFGQVWRNWRGACSGCWPPNAPGWTKKSSRP